MNTFKLRVLAAEKPLYEGDCVSLVIPTIRGQYGIQAMHYNMTAAVVPGVLRLTSPEGEVIISCTLLPFNGTTTENFEAGKYWDGCCWLMVTSTDAPASIWELAAMLWATTVFGSVTPGQ